MKNNPVHISNQGTSFYIAALRCNEIRQTGVNTHEWCMVPANVCFAFSIEVNIKAMIFSEGHKPPSEHNIFKLFSCLNGKPKNNLRINTKGFNKDEFKNEIKKISNAFKDLRYYYELDYLNIKVEFLIKFAEACENMSNSMIQEIKKAGAVKPG